MLQFLLKQQVQILFGPGKTADVGELLKSIGKKRIFLATDKGIVAAGVADKVTRALKKSGLDYVLFDQILPDAPAKFAEEGYDILKKENCDSVIALGGGSTIDTTKAINMLRYNDGPILKYTEGPAAWATIKPSPGLIAIPTTAGTGSEMSDGVILIDENHIKKTILSPVVMPEYSILDAELLVGVPQHILASTGIDALSHLVEGYFSTLATDLTDIICLAGAMEVIEWLPVAFNNTQDLVSRSRLMAASSLGGWMLANVHCNSGHSISHVLGSLFGLPHGFGCAYAMPAVTAFNASVIPGKTKVVGEKFGVKFSGRESPEEIGVLTCQAMEKFRDETLKMKPARDFSPDRSKFPLAAEMITKEAFQMFNAREMSKEQALELLEYIFK